jgi:hypothetical protein
MMNKFIKRVLGIDKLEAKAEEANKLAAEAEETARNLLAKAEAAKIAADAAENDRKEKERLAKLNPKQIATESKQPYFEVVGFHTNPENPRFGFWELDWNEYKVVELKSLGYFGETDEEVVDQWFTEICKESGAALGANMERRAMGFIDVKNIGNGRSEVS